MAPLRPSHLLHGDTLPLRKYKPLSYSSPSPTSLHTALKFHLHPSSFSVMSPVAISFAFAFFDVPPPDIQQRPLRPLGNIDSRRTRANAASPPIFHSFLLLQYPLDRAAGAVSGKLVRACRRGKIRRARREMGCRSRFRDKRLRFCFKPCAHPEEEKVRTGARAVVESVPSLSSFACAHHITVQRGSLEDIRMMTSLLLTILSAKSRPSLSASSLLLL
ncbi:hypothetical protein BT69DRAFT_773493 [Atractiella rhizophila]|nr:hypothetical protein BT69DRAFT_773493 [Atractiella rhizophila]